MTPTRRTAVALLALVLPALAATHRSPPIADPQQVRDVLRRVYDAISGPIGAQRDWQALRDLCAPHARMIAMAQTPDGPAPTVWSVDDYIERAGPGLVRTGFHEREIHAVVEVYGPIAHVFSTYQAHRDDRPDAPPIRGINSVQLVRVGQDWKVMTILWHQESASTPIPPAYLP